MMTQLLDDDSRQKEPFENKSSGTTAMMEGNLSQYRKCESEVGEVSGPSWMDLKESLVFISQVGKDSKDNLCQALSTMHGTCN